MKNSTSPVLRNGHTVNAVGIFDKLASVYQQKFMDVTRYAEGLDFVCENITKEAAPILELACGPGNVTKYLLSQRPDFIMLATDLAPSMLALAAENNPSAQFEIMDCRDMSQLDRHFDGIIAAFCLPYLSKEESIRLIEDASALLSPSGLLYISTMEDAYSNSGFRTGSGGDKMFMYFHETDYLETALKANGLEPVYKEIIPPLPGDGQGRGDLILIAQKKNTLTV